MQAVRLSNCKMLYGLMVGMLLALFVMQSFFSMREDSAIEDEPPHIMAGYALLKTGEARMNPEHPYLVKTLAALPLLFQKINLNLESEWWKSGDEWKFGDEFLYRSGNDADKILLSGRLVILCLGVLLGILVWHFACYLYGKKAGLFALFLYAESPLILAHSRLITTDIGVTLFFVLTLYFLVRFFRSQRLGWLFCVALSFGLANLTKFSAVLLVPILALAFWIFARAAKKNQMKLHFRPWRAFAWLVIFGAFVVWLGYGAPLAPEPAAWQFFSWQNFKNPCFIKIYQSLIPSTYFRGLIDVIIPTTTGRWAFALGKFYKGCWYYFPLAILLKTQIVFLLSLPVLFFYYFSKKIRLTWTEGILWATVIFYLLVSMLQKLDIGIRHILPIFPFVFVLISPLVLLAEKKIGKWFFLIGVLWYSGSTLSQHPGYLQYFNEFVGGPQNGYKYLIDSNLDWGQDLRRLKRYLEENKIEYLGLDYFGGGDPDYYGIKYAKLTPYSEDFKGWVAVSASSLWWGWREKKYDWLQKMEPVAKIGNSIFIYDRR